MSRTQTPKGTEETVRHNKRKRKTEAISTQRLIRVIKDVKSNTRNKRVSK